MHAVPIATCNNKVLRMRGSHSQLMTCRNAALPTIFNCDWTPNCGQNEQCTMAWRCWFLKAQICFGKWALSRSFLTVRAPLALLSRAQECRNPCFEPPLVLCLVVPVCHYVLRVCCVCRRTTNTEGGPRNTFLLQLENLWV